MFSIRKVKASHNSGQFQHLYESYFLLLKKPCFVWSTEVRSWLSVETRDNTFASIRSCGNEVYRVEKSKEDTWEPWKLRSRNFSMTSEEFLSYETPFI